MEEIVKVLTLNKADYYETHLSLINCVLPLKYRLTPTEIKVIAAFMDLEGDLANYRFGPSAKKAVMRKVEISPSGLSNYMGSLLKKGHLIQSGDVISIWPLLNPENHQQIYKFKLLNNNNGNITRPEGQ